MSMVVQFFTIEGLCFIVNFDVSRFNGVSRKNVLRM